MRSCVYGYVARTQGRFENKNGELEGGWTGERTELVFREESVEERVEWCGRPGGWGSRRLHAGSGAGQGEVEEGSECQANFGLCPRD